MKKDVWKSDCWWELPICRCSERCDYDENWDSFYCPQCAEWRDGVCQDPECVDCTARPEKPPIHPTSKSSDVSAPRIGPVWLQVRDQVHDHAVKADLQVTNQVRGQLWQIEHLSTFAAVWLPIYEQVERQVVDQVDNDQ